MGNRGAIPGRGSDGYFLFATASRTVLGSSQPRIHWLPGVKQPGSGADHSPPSSAEIKNAWSYISTPQYVFMVGA